ncbi:hypothetical protein [Thalassobaculum sp.]|uniref:hypothetical protein n=1 Tax=Thalassobaculum sp. TaxID=2022740 RepID=UPI0032ED6CB2
MSVERIAHDDETTVGIRYYEPKIYLLVTKKVDKENKVEFAHQFIYLPDYSRPYVMNMEPGIGVAEMKPRLENGWNLTGVDITQDSKAAETMTAVGSLISVFMPSAAGNRSLEEGLYMLEFDRRTGKLTGFTRVNAIVQ